MTCQEFLELYSDFRDERLTAAAEARFHHHLVVCASCGRYDRVLRQGIELVRDLEIHPAADFLPRLEHRLLDVDEELAAGARPPAGGTAATLALVAVMASIALSPLVARAPASPAVAGATGAAERVVPPTARSLPASSSRTAGPVAWTAAPLLPTTLPAVTRAVGPAALSDQERRVRTPGAYSPVVVGLPAYGGAAGAPTSRFASLRE